MHTHPNNRFFGSGHSLRLPRPPHNSRANSPARVQPLSSQTLINPFITSLEKDVDVIKNLSFLFKSNQDSDKLAYVDYLKQAIGERKDFQIGFSRHGDAIIDCRPTKDYRLENTKYRAFNESLQEPQEYGESRDDRDNQPFRPIQQKIKPQPYNRYTNSLAQRAADPNDCIPHLSNEEFSVIPCKGSEKRYWNPHLLAIPRWKNRDIEEPFIDFADFLERASNKQKIAFVDTMRTLISQIDPNMDFKHHPNFKDHESLIWLNVGRRREEAYMHMHFKPLPGKYAHLFGG